VAEFQPATPIYRGANGAAHWPTNERTDYPNKARTQRCTVSHNQKEKHINKEKSFT
jgi:hypothetical protein